MSQNLKWKVIFFCFWCRALLLWCHRIPSLRSHWEASRPAPSAGTLTLPLSLLVPELPPLESLDLVLELGRCSVASSLVMPGLFWSCQKISPNLFTHFLFDSFTTSFFLLLFSGTHLWSSSCSHMPSWDLPCLKLWDSSVWWLLSLSCLLCKTAPTTL